MSGDQPISWLMFFTLSAGLFAAAALLLAFLRSRRNREIASETLVGDGSTGGAASSGALVELGVFLGVAIVAMGLLAFGYKTHPGVSLAQSPGPAAMPPVNPPDAPRAYEPSHPGRPDLQVPPTGSTVGSGGGTRP